MLYIPRTPVRNPDHKKGGEGEEDEGEYFKEDEDDRQVI